jgi:hypothetical protein
MSIESEQPIEGKFEEFYREFDDFRVKSSKFIEEYIMVFLERPELIGVDLAAVLSSAIANQSITEPRMKRFLEITNRQEELNSENYDFAVEMLKKIDAAYEEYRKKWYGSGLN